MPKSFEELLESARHARRDEIGRLIRIAPAALARAVSRVFAPVSTPPAGFWIPLATHLGPEDRPGC